MTDAQWAQIRDFVDQVCDDLWAHPANRGRRDPGYYNLVARYVAWARFAEGYELDRVLLFGRDMVSFYIATAIPHVTEKTRASYRSQLFAASAALLPASMTPSPIEPIQQRKATTPYTNDEVEALYRWANGQPTQHLRRNANVILALGLGAGFKMREINALTTRHIHVDNEGVVVTSPADGRQVPVRAEWEEIIETAAEPLDEGEFLFRPGRIATKRSLTNAGSDFLATTHQRENAPNAYRLRATWIVGHLVARVPFDVLVRAAGLQEAASLYSYLPLVPEAEFVAVRHMLRAQTFLDRRLRAVPDGGAQ
ncbi:hypothetical protein [Microbacterium sp. GXF6406]